MSRLLPCVLFTTLIADVHEHGNKRYSKDDNTAVVTDGQIISRYVTTVYIYALYCALLTFSAQYTKHKDRLACAHVRTVPHSVTPPLTRPVMLVQLCEAAVITLKNRHPDYYVHSVQYALRHVSNTCKTNMCVNMNLS
jgi:hypothetical protein